MKRVCGWCLKDLGDLDAREDSADKVSVGVCPDCAEFFRRNRPDQPMDEFLNALPVPVVLVDDDVRIEFVNRAACRVLGRSLDECKGKLGGTAFECAYARMPGGCGRTEHCKGCAIRRTVNATCETGLPQQSVSARMLRITSRGEEELRFKISTEPCSDMVLLRIEEMAEVRLEH